MEWLVTTEFVFNNNIYISTKLLLFKANYKKEPRIDFKIRKIRKNAKTEGFMKKMKIHEKANAILKKSQEKIKKYIDKNRKKAVEYKVRDRILLSTKDLTWQMRNKETKKLIEKFVEPYKIKKIISENTVELELLVLMKIHLVVNVSRITLYQKQVKIQKKISLSPVEIEGEKEYKVKKILNKRDVREKLKYLVR